MSSVVAPEKPRRAMTPSTVAGELLITIGVLALLFAFYEAFWTNVASGRMQDRAQDNLQSAWDTGEDGQRVNPRTSQSLELGAAFARMHVPSYGSDWQFALLEGTDEETLRAGPGRYVETQLPGESGNFALAGHRVGKGAPFNDLGALEVCDAIVIETQHEWITYRMLPMSTDSQVRFDQASECLAQPQAERVAHGDYAHVEGRHITVPSDVGVLNPIPGDDSTAGAAATRQMENMLTLTTCHPQFSNAERMIVHAVQTDAQPKQGTERPAVLEEN